MAKIIRKRQDIFAGGVPASNVVAQFGSFQNATPNYSHDLDVIQALPAWENGFADAVVNNYAPAMQDINALFYVVTSQLAYLMQNGIAVYNSTTEYSIGSLVTDDVGGLYMSLTNTNTGNALTSAANWLNYYSKRVTLITTSLNYTVLNSDWYIRWSDAATSENHFIDLPTPSAANSGREIIVKYTGGTVISQLVVRVTGGSTIDGAATSLFNQYNSRRFISNGTNWEVI